MSNCVTSKVLHSFIQDKIKQLIITFEGSYHCEERIIQQEKEIVICAIHKSQP